MPTTLKRLRVFVASPGDTQKERNLLRNVFDEINHGVGNDHGIILDLVSWETHSRPAIGEDAQDVINKQVPSYDILLGFMWKRFGSPTKRAESGTEEEFNLAIARFRTNGIPEIMMYFNELPYYPKDESEIEQMSKVFAFKKRLKELGFLYWTYKGVDQFASIVRKHLEMLVRDWNKKSGHNSSISPISNIDRIELSKYFDTNLILPYSLQVHIDNITSKDKINQFYNYLIKLELLYSTPSLSSTYRPPAHVLYAQRLLKQIDKYKIKKDNFDEIVSFLKALVNDESPSSSFSDILERWKFSVRLSKRKVIDMIIELGSEIEPVIIKTFLELAELEDVDGYYLPGNIMVCLCEVFEKIGGQLSCIALFQYIRDLQNFNCTAMNVGIAALTKIMPSQFTIEDVFQLSRGVSIVQEKERAEKEMKDIREDRIFMLRKNRVSISFKALIIKLLNAIKKV